MTDGDPLTRRQRRASTGKVAVLVNAKGGPRIIHDDETLDLTKTEIVGGGPPSFKIMSPRAAAKYLAKHERGTPRPLAEIVIDRDNIQRTKFLRLVHGDTGMPPPYHEDKWYRDIENKIHADPGSLTDEEIARLEAENWEAKVEITVDADAAEQAQIDAITVALKDQVRKVFSGFELETLPGATLDSLRHERDMLGEFIQRMEANKPVTPSLHRFMGDLLGRFVANGTPVPADVVESLMSVPVQGEGELWKWPTLADEIVHSPVHQKRVITGQTIKRLTNTLKHVEKMVLDSAAVQRVAEAVSAFPEQLAQNAEFARPPFEQCWIELPSIVWADHFGLNQAQSGPDVDERIGFLFTGGRVYVASQAPGLPPVWSPIYYELNTVPSQDKLAREIERINGTRADLNRFYMGKTLLDLAGDNVALSLRAQHGFGVLSGPGGAALLSQIYYGHFAGDVPLIVALLLAINTPSNQAIKYTDVPRRWRSTHKGKRPLHAHRIVTIDLDRAPGVQLISREHDEDREKRHVGWHTVRGHFVHDKRYREVKAKGLCDHGPGGEWWTEFEPNKWECLNCGAKRTWRTYPNGRGDPNKPVEHHYHVKG
jgi:hypothetical protein